MTSDDHRPDYSTRWRPGESGNPGGSAQGSRRRITKILDQIGDERASEILESMVAKAISGDVAAADMLFRRVWPPRKGAPVKIEGMPKIVKLSDVPVALECVTSAMCSAEISPEEAASIAAVLDATRRSLETIELEQRISALERKSI